VTYATASREAGARLDAGVGRLRTEQGRTRYAAASHPRAVAGGLLDASALVPATAVTGRVAHEAVRVADCLPTGWDPAGAEVIVDAYLTAAELSARFVRPDPPTGDDLRRYAELVRHRVAGTVTGERPDRPARDRRRPRAVGRRRLDPQTSRLSSAQAGRWPPPGRRRAD
jgi:hypothetical protein